MTKEAKWSNQGKWIEIAVPDKKTSRKITEETLEYECPTIFHLHKVIMKHSKKLKKYIKNKNEKDILEYWNNNIKKVEEGQNIDELEKEILEEYKKFIKTVDAKWFSSESKQAFNILNKIADFKHNYKKEGAIIKESLDENDNLLDSEETNKKIIEDFWKVHDGEATCDTKFPNDLAEVTLDDIKFLSNKVKKDKAISWDCIPNG